MSRYIGPKEKLERRAGVKLFLKPQRCLSQKCAMIRRPYAPGIFGKKSGTNLSEYGRQLREKQKVKIIYGLSERQFRRYINDVLRREKSTAKTSGAVESLVKKLEQRLDNAVFRGGFAPSRTVARQLVSHGHFCVNGKRISVPSYALKIGDMISIRPESKTKSIFSNLETMLKNVKPPSWLEVSKEKHEIKICGMPTIEDTGEIANLQSIFEFYSR